MKKTFALILCLMLCMSLFLVGCDSKEGGNDDGNTNDLSTLAGKTPEQLYQAAMDSLKDVTSFESVSTQKIVMSAQGESMTMNQKVVSKQNGYDVYLKSENDMAPDAEMEVTYVDGMYYLIQNGQKLKKAISHEEMDAMVEQIYGEDMSTQTLIPIPEEMFEDISFQQDGSSYTLTFMVEADYYTSVMKNAGIAGATFTEDVEYIVYFDADGNLEKVVANFTFDVSGIKCDAVSTTIVTVGNVSITAPADADSYTEIG